MEHDAERYTALFFDRVVKLARRLAKRMEIQDVEECESAAIARLGTSLLEYCGASNEAEVWLWVKRSVWNALKDVSKSRWVLVDDLTGNVTEPSWRGHEPAFEAKDDLDRALAAVPADYREVIRLRLQGWSHEVIAQKLNLKPHTSREYFVRGMRIIQKCCVQKPISNRSVL